MSPINYKSTKSYLRYYISELPKRGWGEGGRLANYLGVSTTLVSQVLSGEKLFTAEQTVKLIKYIGLKGMEADYISFLNQYERSGTDELKSYWKLKLDEIRNDALKIAIQVRPQKTLTAHEQAIFYSSHIYSAIRLYTSTSPNGKTLFEIAERFALERTKVQEIMNFLVETGLCRFENDQFTMGAQSTHLDQGSPHLLRHHTQWRLKTIQLSESIKSEELMYTVVVSLSKNDFSKLREEMVLFIKTFLDKVHKSPAEEVACFNMDWFWYRKD